MGIKNGVCTLKGQSASHLCEMAVNYMGISSKLKLIIKLNAFEIFFNINLKSKIS